MFKNFLNNKNIPYITIPLAIAAFVFLSIIILNFTGATGLVSNLFFAYINQDIPSTFTFNTGHVAGVSDEDNDPIARTCWDPVKGHCYPRRGIFHWRSFSTPAEWYAKFDFIVTGTTGSGFPESIKQLNPNTYVLWTKDWQAGAGINDWNLPSEWRSVNSEGDYIEIYGGMRYLMNFTEYCDTSSSYNNQKYSEYLPEYFANVADLNYFDGVSSDGNWTKIHGISDIDFDKNGQNDYVEYDENWVQRKWLSGMKQATHKLRDIIGDDEIIIFNPGGMQEYFSDGSLESELNGIISEDTGRMYSFKYFKRTYDHWMRYARQPNIILIDGEGPKKDYFSNMRFLLGTTMTGNGYFNFYETTNSEYSPRSNEHWYKEYYDEFDLNLGYPTSDLLAFDVPSNNSEAVYVRFFDNGLLLLNMNSQPRDVSDQDLRDKFGNQYDTSDPDGDGWDGYYRFKGGQDPNFNNGQIFENISLKNVREYDMGYVGDAILLTKEPTTMVTDIFIDTKITDTSPGSDKALLSGNWVDVNSMSGPEKNKYCKEYFKGAWGQVCRAYVDLFTMDYALPGSTVQALFTPTINVPGNYAIYEWHGEVKEKDSATNVKYTVGYANNSSEEFTIDQSQNIGQWNKLSIFSLSSGNSNNVTISAQNANGVVIADAIRFVYQGNHGNIKGPPGDYTPAYLSADFNCDNKIDIQDFGILLSHWHKLNNQVINYQHSNCESARSIDLVIDKNNKVNIFDLSLLLSCWGTPDATKTTCWQEQIQ